MTDSRLTDDARLAEAFRRMESSLHDLRHMSTIAAEMIEDLVTDIGKGRSTEQRHDITLFAVFHVEQMVKNLMQEWSDGFKLG